MIKLLRSVFIVLVIFSVIGIAGAAIAAGPLIRLSTDHDPYFGGWRSDGQFTGYTIDTHGTVHQWRGFAASVKDSSVIDTLAAERYRDLLHTAYACDSPR